MAVAAGHMTTEPAPSSPSPDGVPEAAVAPRLAERVELLGEYKDSEYSQPPSLVRRPDGQIVQMSRCCTA
jgi:putative peptide zinc metalloprotease protein